MKDERDTRTPVGQGFSLADDQIERALAELTDVAPSPQFRAKVMDRLGEGRRTVGAPWKTALAASVVVLVAAVVWFTAGRPGPPPTRPPGVRLPDVALTDGVRSETAPFVPSAGGLTPPRRDKTGSFRPDPIQAARSAAPAADAQPLVLPPIDTPPIGNPLPVAVDPLVVEPDGVRPLELGPLVPPEIPEIKGERR